MNHLVVVPAFMLVSTIYGMTVTSILVLSLVVALIIFFTFIISAATLNTWSAWDGR
jgi:hypothetical protein